MNESSLLNNWIIDQFDLDDSVNTISTVDTREMDNNKTNIYPLVNVDLLSSQILEQVIIQSFKVTVIQQRDIYSRKTDSKLLENSNYIDNINETHSICQRFINVLTHQNNDINIEIDRLTDLDILKNWRGSGVDGCQFTIDLSIQNKGLSC
jgi:hypothetical protein